MKKKVNYSRKSSNLIFIIIIIVATIITLFSFAVYRRLTDAVAAESSVYLQEVAMQKSDNLIEVIQDSYNTLEKFRGFIVESDISTFEELGTVSESYADLRTYKELYIVDNLGNVYNTKGEQVEVESEEFVDAIVNVDPYDIETNLTIDGDEVFAVVVDARGLSIDEITVRGLMVTEEQDVFEGLLSTFSGEGYSYITKNDGSDYLHFSPNYTDDDTQTLFEIMNNGVFYGDYSVDKVVSDMALGLSGTTQYNLDGIDKYMTYVPFGSSDWYIVMVVPFDAVGAQTGELIDMIAILSVSMVVVFILYILFIMVGYYKSKRNLEGLIYTDTVTGGNTLAKFSELMEEKFSKDTNKKYALVYTNVRSFKLMNEQLGRDACDSMLYTAYNAVKKDLQPDEFMGRWFADHICMLLNYESNEKTVERFERWNKLTIDEHTADGQTAAVSVTIEYGVYVVEDTTMDIMSMLDFAKMALNGTQEIENYGKRFFYSFYNDEYKRRLIREKYIKDIMENSLRSNEFKLYLQPKYDPQTERISGAEALARWVQSDGVMIYPGEFIPIFEKSGFIAELDLWMFEQTCLMLSSWKKQRKPLVKISVNCSRVHIRRNDFLKRYIEISKKYNVPPRYLEIEITESVVFEDVNTLINIIKDIRAAGFGCSMDDFGSGYSSLNLIQDIPVDTLKLDRAFFQAEEIKSRERAESVIGSILMMTKALNMQTVAEGVEEEHNVIMLRRLGCNHIQGFYYAKPMPKEEFETLYFDELGED